MLSCLIMKNLLFRYALAFSLLFPMPMLCTTVVVIATQSGIVITTDSKTGVIENGIFTRSLEHHPKFVILNNRFVIAAAGTVDIRSGRNHFEFLPWATGLQFRIANDATVEQLAGRVKNESASMFLRVGIDDMVKNGTYKNSTDVAPCEMFTQFIVAGLQAGTWHLYKVQYDIDWRNKRLLGPTEEDLESEWNPFGPERPLVFRFGVVEAIQDANNHESYAYKKIKELSPKAIADFESGMYHLPLQETIALSRALVQVEKDTNPTLVGGDIKSAEILPDGTAKEVPDPQP